MARLLDSLAEVGCRKLGCKSSASLARHHKGHQAMWLGPWTRQLDIPRYANFVRRYQEFRDEDVVMLCTLHHAEIHHIYDSIIAKHKESLGGRRLYRYTWSQAHELMKLLEAECDVWLGTVTLGYSPTKLDLDRVTKKRRENKLKRRLKKR